MTLFSRRINARMAERMKAAEDRAAMLEQQLNDLVKAAEGMQDRAYLFGIERQGRILKLNFIRKGKIFTIETISTISDNIPGWKKQAGLE